MSHCFQKLVILAIISIGFAKDQPLERIVGGVETSIQYVPHQVSLQYHGGHLCGGSIISQYLILTAAHCVADFENPSAYTVRVGSSHHQREGFLYSVERILPHESFNQAFKRNHDIALVKLEKPLQYSDVIQPIALGLPVTIGDRPLFKYYVSGWGVTSSGSEKLSDTLRLTFVHLVNWQFCQRLYAGVSVITSDMFCAGTAAGGRDSCQGDSGGGLTEVSPNGSVRLLGVISRGRGCGLGMKPGIYINVAVYRQWIEASTLKLLA